MTDGPAPFRRTFRPPADAARQAPLTLRRPSHPAADPSPIPGKGVASRAPSRQAPSMPLRALLLASGLAALALAVRPSRAWG